MLQPLRPVGSKGSGDFGSVMGCPLFYHNHCREEKGCHLDFCLLKSPQSLTKRFGTNNFYMSKRFGMIVNPQGRLDTAHPCHKICDHWNWPVLTLAFAYGNDVNEIVSQSCLDQLWNLMFVLFPFGTGGLYSRTIEHRQFGGWATWATSGRPSFNRKFQTFGPVIVHLAYPRECNFLRSWPQGRPIGTHYPCQIGSKFGHNVRAKCRAGSNKRANNN